MVFCGKIIGKLLPSGCQPPSLASKNGLDISGGVMVRLELLTGGCGLFALALVSFDVSRKTSLPSVRGAKEEPLAIANCCSLNSLAA